MKEHFEACFLQMAVTVETKGSLLSFSRRAPNKD